VAARREEAAAEAWRLAHPARETWVFKPSIHDGFDASSDEGEEKEEEEEEEQDREEEETKGSDDSEAEAAALDNGAGVGLLRDVGARDSGDEKDGESSGESEGTR
jgi:hypothetical protein